MILKDNENNDKTELSFRPIADPREGIYSKMDKKDIVITVLLYIILFAIIGYNLFV